MKAKPAGRGLAGRAIVLAAIHALLPRRKLPISKLGPLFESLPADFELLVADVGSIGGLHPRWTCLGRHLATVSFDPLDQRPGTGRDRVFPVLLGGIDGQARLNITRRGSMSSTLEPDQAFFEPFWNKSDDIGIVDSLTAKSTSLDSLAASEQFAPDALKVDVQGGEAAVLAGATRVLGQSVLVAEIECSFAARYEGQQTFDQVAASMRERGFALLDLRRLKRYRFKNSYGVDDPSLGRGMRPGQLAFCDAIFIVEPDRLFDRIEKAGQAGPDLGLKAVVLLLVYGKADLAAATFDRIRPGLPEGTRQAFEAFFRALSGDGGWRQRLHHVFDRWAKRV